MEEGPFSVKGEPFTEEEPCEVSDQEHNRSIDLVKKRRKSIPYALRYPPLTEAMILTWADAHHARTGRWPTAESGLVVGGDGRWGGLDQALAKGTRTLPGGSSLAKLLEQHRGHRNRANLSPLTEEQILCWADEHYARTGAWPTSESGEVVGTAGESWGNISQALAKGLRTLPGGSSLARLLGFQRGRRNPAVRTSLTEAQILAWADAHCERTGRWPNTGSGLIIDGDGDTWNAISEALQRGTRSLPGGSSLAKLLQANRSRPNQGNLPKLTQYLILDWVDAYRERTGQWPTPGSGPISQLPGESWKRVDISLAQGIRGLPKGGSLAQLLLEHRGVRHHLAQPPLTEDTILSLADAFYARCGRWPNRFCGTLDEEPEETWARLDSALRVGLRNLPGGSSLARLLAERRGALHPMYRPDLTVEQILLWADAYYRRTGAWPTESSEPIPEAPGETWNSIASALRLGRRGLPAGSSLARLVADVCERSRRRYTETLTVEQILEWADAHHARTGRWPASKSGAVGEAVGGLTWRTVHQALLYGGHGLPGGETLAGLLGRVRKARSRSIIVRVSEDEILDWAQAYVRRTGRWPTVTSGVIEEAPDETWNAINMALTRGKRGLPGGSSLAQLLDRIRKCPDRVV